MLVLTVDEVFDMCHRFVYEYVRRYHMELDYDTRTCKRWNGDGMQIVWSKYENFTYISILEIKSADTFLFYFEAERTHWTLSEIRVEYNELSSDRKRRERNLTQFKHDLLSEKEVTI